MGASGTGPITPDRPERDGRRNRLYQWAFADAGPGSPVRIVVRILLIMYEEFFRTNLTLRASALTYSIILSLVPILALSTAILKGMGSDEELKTSIIRLVDQWEPQAAAVPKTDEQVGEPAAVPGTSLHRAIDIIFEYVDRTNFAALGAFGVIGLVAVILLVLASIEDAMNAIWHTDQGRSLGRKIMDYLALLIVLPLSLNVALAAETILASDSIMQQFGRLLPAGWAGSAATFINLAPFVLIVLTLMMMYLFFPQRKVQPGAALVGAVFAAVFWFLFQKLYITLQIGVAKYNAIYGSFASIPLFLVWMHIGWTCILLGATLAYAIQHHQYYHPDQDGPLPVPQRRLQLAFDLLDRVYADFDQRIATTWKRLEAELPRESPADVRAVAELLRARGLLQCTGPDEDAALVPITTREQLQAGEVVMAVMGDAPSSTRGGRLAALALAAAAREVDLAPRQEPASAATNLPARRGEPPA
ncbi:MAG: YihY/virulence factor BrkB family protein [Desulfobulbus sp.]|jgi:membrane protein